MANEILEQCFHSTIAILTQAYFYSKYILRLAKIARVTSALSGSYREQILRLFIYKSNVTEVIYLL
jgi:hypothetical protein